MKRTGISKFLIMGLRIAVVASLFFSFSCYKFSKLKEGIIVHGAKKVKGKYGVALKFDGKDDYAETNLDVRPVAMQETTWMAWIYPTSQEGMRMVFSNDDGGYDRGVQSSRGDGLFNVFTGNGTWRPVRADLNMWQHIAVVYTKDNIYFYKNGVKYEYGKPPSGPQETKYNLNIGRNPGFGEYFAGIIDEVRIYNRALTEDEIKKIYANHAQIKDGLVGDWGF